MVGHTQVEEDSSKVDLTLGKGSNLIHRHGPNVVSWIEGRIVQFALLK